MAKNTEARRTATSKAKAPSQYATTSTNPTTGRAAGALPPPTATLPNVSDSGRIRLGGAFRLAAKK